MPSVHIRDNLDLLPNAYRLTLMGVSVAEAEIYPDRELAINPGQVFGSLNGIAGKDPAFGLEAVWIEPGQRDQAQSLGYTVVDASTVVATHLNQVLHKHAHELLGHEEVQQLLQLLARSSPKLAEELVPGLISCPPCSRSCRRCSRSRCRCATSVPSPRPSPTSLHGVKIPARWSPRFASRCPAQSCKALSGLSRSCL